MNAQAETAAAATIADNASEATATGKAEAVSKLHVQLISDQHSAAAGSMTTFHLLYHNKLTKDKLNAVIHVKVAEGMEIDPADLEASAHVNAKWTWDAITRILTYPIVDLAAQGSGVFNFHLKVNDKAAHGSKLFVMAKVNIDGQDDLTTAQLPITVGTEIHQPIFDGYPDGGFHPLANLSRAETAAIVTRVMQLQDSAAKTIYTDVPADHWAARYINAATNAGYMEGANGNFRPEDPITRAELVTLALRMKGVFPIPLQGFPDVKGHWSFNSVNTAKALMYIDGDSKGDFLPDLYIARQEAAKLIAIALDRGQLTDGQAQVIQHFNDVSTEDWAFGWVEESAMSAHESEMRGHFSEELIRYLPDQTNPF
jgi:hypothetical protein